MCFFKSKYEKLTREDVNDAICKLEAENSKIDEELKTLDVQIQNNVELAKKERSKEIKLNYVKKVNYLKRRRTNIAKRSTYLLYNIELMERLKDAIDDNQMFKMSNGLSLNKLLSDQKGLRKFLMASLNIKQESERNLVASNETFDTVNDLYEENEEIYGKNEADDELLANFEKEEGLLDELNSETVQEEIENSNLPEGDK